MSILVPEGQHSNSTTLTAKEVSIFLLFFQLFTLPWLFFYLLFGQPKENHHWLLNPKMKDSYEIGLDLEIAIFQCSMSYFDFMTFLCYLKIFYLAFLIIYHSKNGVVCFKLLIILQKSHHHFLDCYQNSIHYRINQHFFQPNSLKFVSLTQKWNSL